MELLELAAALLTKLYKDGKLDLLFIVASVGGMVRIAASQIRKIIERLNTKDIEDARRDEKIDGLKGSVERLEGRGEDARIPKNSA